MSEVESLVCPLCSAVPASYYHSDIRRDYYLCNRCRLIFVPPRQHLLPVQEKAHYDLHQNNSDDQDYRQFLSRLAVPLTAVLDSGAKGLDFGSGPGPTLSVMLQELGFNMAVYDIFYANDLAVLQEKYDFITTTEVVEHLSAPGDVLDQLWLQIKPSGWLGIMTKIALDHEAFCHWHYKNDPTHICFYHRETFEYLAQRWGGHVKFIANDVVLVHKI